MCIILSYLVKFNYGLLVNAIQPFCDLENALIPCI